MSWDELEAAPQVPDDDGTAQAFAQCFATPAGARVLAHLVKATRARVVPPTAADAVLRDLEGQRRLVDTILNLIERGRQGPA